MKRTKIQSKGKKKAPVTPPLKKVAKATKVAKKPKEIIRENPTANCRLYLSPKQTSRQDKQFTRWFNSFLITGSYSSSELKEMESLIVEFENIINVVLRKALGSDEGAMKVHVPVITLCRDGKPYQGIFDPINKGIPVEIKYSPEYNKFGTISRIEERNEQICNHLNHLIRGILPIGTCA